MVRPESGGDELSQRFAGDFTTADRSDVFEEGCAPSGLWQLNGPRGAAVPTGSAIAKLLFLPCDYAPSTFLVNMEKERGVAVGSPGGAFHP